MRLREQLGISALLARSAPVDSIRRAVKKVLAASQAPHGPAPSHSAPPPNATLLEIDEERAEEIRLHKLDQMGLVDTGAQEDEELHKIVEATARRFKVPIAMISLVLEDKQWFKAQVGLAGRVAEERSIKREWSLCSHVVQGRQPLVINDAAVHPAFAQNPLVQDGTVRSYVGAPLETPSGEVLGTLCIIDVKPMAISAEEVDELVLVARAVAGELELRADRKRKPQEAARLPPEGARPPRQPPAAAGGGVESDGGARPHRQRRLPPRPAAEGRLRQPGAGGHVRHPARVAPRPAPRRGGA